MNKGKFIIILLSIIIAIVFGIISRDEKNEVIKFDDLKETKIVLYFSNPETKELVKEYRYVNIEDIKKDISNTIVTELLKGPENKELVTQIPKETRINSILTENEKIIIDFSKEFALNSEDELENLHKIYSVVNSLTEITEINEVEIKVEGKTLTNKVRL